MLGIEVIQPVNRYVMAGPLGCGQLRERIDCSVGYQGEDRSPYVTAVVAICEGFSQRSVDSKPAPEGIQYPG